MRSAVFLFSGILSRLSFRRKKQLTLLLAFTLVSAIAELLSFGSVIPFLGAVAEPDLIWNSLLIKKIAPLLGWSEPSHMLAPLALVFSLVVFVTALVRLSSLWFAGRLAAAIGSDLSCEAYRKTLLQPYLDHISVSSSQVINVISRQVARAVGAINSLLVTIASVLVAASLLIGMLLLDWVVACSAIAVLATAYALIISFTRARLASNSKRISTAAQMTIKALQEGLGAIRDVLIDGTQSTYLQIYSSSDRPLRFLQAQNYFLGTFPRFALEALGMIGISILAYFVVIQKGSGAAAIPLLGAFALGAQRLLPALQQAYSGWSSIQSSTADLEAVLEILQKSVPSHQINCLPMNFRRSLSLHKISFGYPGGGLVVKELSFSFRAGERVAIIGQTGSGKSTLVDIVMGLLPPSSGKILVDGFDLYESHDPSLTLASWRRLVSHVPQHIYLADSSFAENIAFGVPPSEIDMERVKFVSQQAQIDDFIESTPLRYKSFVGERGIRLSGGQRQRIGIARALYKNSRLLVLDEATSALDGETESRVINSIESLDRDLTIIMIAHRLSTISKCDRVIRLEHGRVVADGSPCQVLNQA